MLPFFLLWMLFRSLVSIVSIELSEPLRVFLIDLLLFLKTFKS